MAKETDITARFKLDISDLKKNITEANRQIKLANAEFKSATSGMDDWAKSSDGLNAKIKQLNTVLTEQKNKLKTYQDQLASAQKYEKEASENVSRLRSELDKAKATYGENSDEVKKLEAELSKAEQTEAKLKNQVTDMTVTMKNQEATVNKTQKELDGYNNALEEVEREAQKGEDAIDDLNDELANSEDASKKASDGFSVMKGALANLVADGIRLAIDAVKDFVSETIKVGKEFDSSMSQVQAVSGATGKEIEQLRDKAKEMGANTKFSASEAADAFNYMAMAGWKTEDMLNGIDGILALAAAGNTDLATTSDIVTDALTAFGKTAGDSGRLANIMAAASSNANTNIEMMGGTFKYVAPVAGALGYSMEDVAVATGLMANAGIKAEQGGTALRSILTRLASPPKEAAMAMDALGISITNADGTMKPLSTVMDILRNRFNGLSESQQAQMAKALAGQEAMSGLLAIVNSAPADVDKLTQAVYGSSLTIDSFNASAKNVGIQIQDMRKAFEEAGVSAEDFNAMLKLSGNDADTFIEALRGCVNEGYNADEILKKLGISSEDLQKAMDNSTGAAEEMATVMQDNLGGDLTQLGSKFEGVQIALYEKFEPALRAGVDALSAFVDGLQFVVDHASPFLATITGLGTAVGVFLLALNWGTIMSACVTALNGLKTAFVALNTTMMANPIALVVALIAGLVVAFTTLWNTSEEFRQFWIDLWEKIKTTVQPVVDFISDMFSKAWDKIKEVWGQVTEFFSNLWSKLTGDAEPKVGSISEIFSKTWDKVKEIWGIVKDWFADVWEGIKTSVQPLIEAISSAFKEGWELIKVIWDLVQPYFQNVWENIKAVFSVVADVLSSFFEAGWILIKGIWDVVVPYFQALWETIKAVFSVVGEILGGFFRTAWEAIKLIWDVVVGYFTLVWQGIATVFSVVKSVLSGNFGDAWNAIKAYWDKVKGYFQTVWDGIKAVFSSTKKWFGDTFSSAWEAIKKVFSTWKKFFSGLWDTIKNTFTGMGTKIGDGIGKAVKGAINGVISAIESTVNKGVDLINGAIGLINKLPGVNVGNLGRLKLPRLYRGGVLKKGQVGLLEGSGAEAVVPLERNKAWIKKVVDELRAQLNVSPMLSSIRGGLNGMMGGLNSTTNNVNNNFTQIINAPKQPSRAELYRQTRNLLNLKGV